MLATPLARPWTVAAGEAATAGEAAQSACEAPGFTPPRDRACGPGRLAGRIGPLTVRLAGRRVAIGLGVLGALGALGTLDVRVGRPDGAAVDAVIGAAVIGTPVVGTPPIDTAAVGVVFGVLAQEPFGALVTVPVDRVEVRAGAVSPGPCARTAGRVRFDRSGRLKNSHGSRLFRGEGPTGEDNAARAAGPPTA
ncbi:hypothetical protein ACH4E7_18450 [Kitasatospora sp. NPDC018058]|uniref:hypothetical protein n=1 Tax=Kitasatospora sp. NPDC018058 TaxID=3364025 RepID=UPI0037C08C42